MSTRHQCIQWGATLVWALLYSLLLSQTLLTFLYRLLALYEFAQHTVFNGETGRDIIGDYFKQFFPSFKSFMINLENLIKIGIAGGNKSNRKGWNLWMQLVQVEMASHGVVYFFFILALPSFFYIYWWPQSNFFVRIELHNETISRIDPFMACCLFEIRARN